MSHDDNRSWDANDRTQIDRDAPLGEAEGNRTLIGTQAPLGELPERTLIAPQPTVLPLEAPTATASPRAGAPAPATPGHESIDLQLGMQVEQFELIRELGRGGMGQVFLARDTKLGRLVALKFLGLRSPQLIERFLVEARATAQCHHENIVVIYEADESNGLPYMALEYLEGQTLTELLGQRPLSARRAVELMLPIARALERAHELGIVHRDLKPDNIIVTRAGQVKVLDFGIAKLFGRDEVAQRMGAEPQAAATMTQQGAIVGTMPYMSPEQWGTDAVDHRTDLWAVGIIFWKMLTGLHPVEPTTPARLRAMAAMSDEPLPRIEQVDASIPADLAGIVDSCLAKSKHQRLASAAALVAALEPLAPSHHGRRLDATECPYPGMAAFQEGDASRFFGRDRDIDHMVQRMRDQPLVGVVGPSGVGKSSFVRAGVIPALKASDDSWEILITRPGRDPLAGLATVLHPIAQTGATDLRSGMAEHAQLTTRLRAEPGFLGTLLRSRARQKRGRILLFVDQFEELYTLVDDADERRAYTACLAGMADDPSTPLRVVVSMRSDLLDRAAEDRAFMDRLGAGLLFLPPITRPGMRDALLEPLETTGYAFEADTIVGDMLNTLQETSGALPLMQFTASKLWEQRDQVQRLLTVSSYTALGGVAGALATHADEMLASFAPAQQRLTRSIFQRLVTSEGTRAIADVEDLAQLSSNPAEVRALLDQLVGARLLVIQGRGEQTGAAVEIVHESLLHSWPTLRRWREENAEDGAFLEQLQMAAKQWDTKGRPSGLLWRGETTEEARRFQRRYKGSLPGRDRSFLDAVVALSTRSTRRKRRLVAGGFAFMAALIVGALIALVWIRGAEQTAQDQRSLAEQETTRARAAETEVRQQISTIRQQKKTIEVTEASRDEATKEAEVAEEKVKEAESERKLTYAQLEQALSRAKRASIRAEKMANENSQLAKSERSAKERAESLNREKQATIQALKKKLKTIATSLD